jgi:hypothetical protein
MPVTTPRTRGTAASTEVVIHQINTKTISVCILGTRPVVLNRASEKAKRELLLPAGRKTEADKQANLKHDPLAEFRAAPYTLPEPEEPTFLAGRADWFKGAMMTAALDLPGAKKTQIGRLVLVEGEKLPLWGLPECFMAIVRSAGIEKTPDVRTRAIVPRWAMELTVSFVSPMLNERSVINLLAAAGVTAGVGDWRPEKGKGTFGQFVVCDPEDERFLAVKAEGGRAAQMRAMGEPVSYDDETGEMLAWFEQEVRRRGKGDQLQQRAESPSRLVAD